MSTPAPSYSFGQRLAVVARCLSLGCPRCGKRPIATLFSFHKTCPQCGLVIDKGNGFLLGALPISYGLFVIFWLVPLLVAMIRQTLSYPLSFGLIAAGAVVIPVLLYNYCKMLSLSLYYFFMIHELHQPDAVTEGVTDAVPEAAPQAAPEAEAQA